jgi:hypothetical protein
VHTMKATTMTAEKGYPVSFVLGELGRAGVPSQRETVAWVSDNVLRFTTRSTPNGKRRWTRAQIEVLVTAFSLQKHSALTWDEVGEELAADTIDPAVIEHVQQRAAVLSERRDELARELEACERLSRTLSELSAPQMRLPLAASA